MRRWGGLVAFVLWLASLGFGNAQTITNALVLPTPVQTTDKIFIFRGTAPVYSTTVAALLSGLNTGVYGPASSTNGFVPLWNGSLGNALSAGLAVGLTGINTIIETNSSGLIATSILPSAVSLLGNTVTGSGNVVLQTAPTVTSAILNSATLNSATVGATGESFRGSASGSVTLLAVANAGGTIRLPNATGNAVTTGDTGTVSNNMLSASNVIINGVSCQLGTGCVVPLVFNNLAIINTPIQYTSLPTGSPKTYACFDVNGKLISNWFRCAP